jgi:hypothetical protein
MECVLSWKRVRLNVGSERNIKEGANANTKPHTNAEQEDSGPFLETTVLLHG